MGIKLYNLSNTNLVKMKKYIQLCLFVWVMFYTYSDKEFIEKINSLPIKSVSEGKISFSTAHRPHYILYWQD
jgi:hypothetical protein